MIDPHNITRFDRTDHELDEFALFCPLVAGKRATTIAVRLDRLLTDLSARPGMSRYSPFYLVLHHALELPDLLRQYGFGCYTAGAKACLRVARDGFDGSLNLRTCSVEQLEELPGWGAKTARFFLLHSRPGMRLAALDTHMLKHLREKGHDAPKVAPPPGPTYRKWEKVWLDLCDQAGVSPAEYDLRVWRSSTTSKPLELKA